VGIAFYDEALTEVAVVLHQFFLVNRTMILLLYLGVGGLEGRISQGDRF
jgi:hypothetical protein